MRRAGALILLLCFVVVLAPPPGAQEKATPSATGYWEGTVDLQGSPMRVQVELSGGEADWSGQIDIPEQGIRDVQLEEIAVNGSEVLFTMKGVAGDPTFAGTLADDGKTLTGNMQVASAAFAFSLDRRDTPFPDDSELFAAYHQPGVPGEGPAGVWLGILNAGLAKLRLDLKISQAEDGTLSGTVASPDQGSLALPVSNVTYEDGTLTFVVAPIGGRFTGKMAEDGSAVTGEWYQAQLNYAMLFRRQTPEETMTSDSPEE